MNRHAITFLKKEPHFDAIGREGRSNNEGQHVPQSRTWY